MQILHSIVTEDSLFPAGAGREELLEEDLEEGVAAEELAPLSAQLAFAQASLGLADLSAATLKVRAPVAPLARLFSLPFSALALAWGPVRNWPGGSVFGWGCIAHR